MEFIGDSIALLFLIGLAIGLGIWLALITWGLVRRRGAGQKKFVFAAGLLPLASLIYVFAFSIAWANLVPAAHETFPGDFEEPLPGGYELKGLDKMPEYAYIQPQDQQLGSSAGVSDVATIAVEGPIIFGSFRHPQDYDSPNYRVEHPKPFFAFDTRSGRTRYLDSQQEVDVIAGHSVQLIATERFSSQEPEVKRLRRLSGVLEVIIPFLLLATLTWKIFAWRKLHSRIRTSDSPDVEPIPPLSL